MCKGNSSPFKDILLENLEQEHYFAKIPQQSQAYQPQNEYDE